jgi:phosphoglycerate-specific signal transduction histidine kinase
MSDHKNGIIISGTLGIVLLVSAIASYLTMKHLDTNYNSILSSEVRLQKSIHLLERDCNHIQRSLLNMLLAGDSAEIVKLRAEALEASKRIDKQIDKLTALKSTEQGNELLEKITKNSMQYRQACASFIMLVDTKDIASAVAYNKKELYPMLLRFQRTQEEVSDFISSSTIKDSNKITSNVANVGFWTIGISSVPVTAWVLSGLTLSAFLTFPFLRKKLKMQKM